MNEMEPDNGKKRKKIIWVAVGVIVVAALVVLGIWLGANFLGSANPAAPSAYSAVYLASGDIYYGKLHWFPSLHLTDVWYLQRAVDQQGKQQLGIAPFKNVFWGPVDEIYLNQKQVIFWTRLRNDSQLVAGLTNPAALQPPAAGAPPIAPPPQQSTSTFRGPSGPPPSSR